MRKEFKILTAKSKGKKNAKKNGKVKAGKAIVLKPKVGGLDPQARAYARLLANPCSAPLAHPVYQGGEGGMLARYETSFTFAGSATDTAGLFIWAPGCISPTQGTGVYTAANSSTATILSTGGSGTYVPGLPALQSIASSARIVSACVQVMWPGTEFNRQGFVSCGQVSGALLKEGTTGAVLSVDNVRPLLTFGQRIPTDAAEIRFRPFSGDAAWTDPSVDDSVAATNGAIALAFYGLPVSTGVRMRIVAVYEYTPKFSTSQAIPVASRTTSGNTQNEVITSLDKNDPNWYYKVGNNVGNLARGFSDSGNRYMDMVRN